MDLIQASGVSKTADGRSVLDLTDIAVGKGRITGIVDGDYERIYNLFAILTGTYIPDTGSVVRSDELASNPLFYIRGNIAADTASCSDYYRTFSSPYPHRDDDLFIRLCERYGIPPKARLHRLPVGTKNLLDLIVAISCRPSLIIAQDPLAGLDDDAYDMMVDDLREANRHGTAILVSSPSAEELREYCHDVIDLGDNRRNRGSVGSGNGHGEVPNRFELPRTYWPYAISILPFIISYGFTEFRSNLLSVSMGCAVLMTTFFLSDMQIMYGQDVRKVSAGVDRTSLESRRCAILALCSLAAALFVAAFCQYAGMERDAVISGTAMTLAFLPLTLLRHRAMLSYWGKVIAVNLIVHSLLWVPLFFFMTAEPESLVFNVGISAAVIAVCIVASAFLFRGCVRYFRTKDLEPVVNF